MSKRGLSVDKTKLRVALAKKGISQLELAKRAEISPSTISLFWKAGRGARPATVKVMADVLEVSVEDLIKTEEG